MFFILPPKQAPDTAAAATAEAQAPKQPMYGVVYYRQLDSEKVKAAATEEQAQQITRNAVQKSVCLLMSQPLFEAYLRRLVPVARSFFERSDLDRSVLTEFFDSLVAKSQQEQEKEQEQAPQAQEACQQVYSNYMRAVQDVPVRAIVRSVGARHALQLLKLVLAEQRVVVAACKGNVHRACQLVMLLGSLVPMVLGSKPFFVPTATAVTTSAEAAETAPANVCCEAGVGAVLWR